MKKENIIVISAGAAVGLAAIALTLLGNPANMGFCIACFLRDIAGACGLHSAAKVQYLRPEIIGLVLGAFIMSVATREFRARAGSAPAVRFVLGGFVMIGALAFLGCPLRMVLRLGGGDLNALVGLVGFTIGISIGVVFLKKGFTLGRSYEAKQGEGGVLPIVMAALLILVLAVPALFKFSEEGPRLQARPLPHRPGHRPGSGRAGPEVPHVHGGRHPGYHHAEGRPPAHRLHRHFRGGPHRQPHHRQLQAGLHHAAHCHSSHLWNLLGMVLVGWGSVLLGGCPLRQLILAGSGSGDSAVTVFGMIVGAAMAHNFGLAGNPDSLNEAKELVVGGISNYGKAAVVLGLIVMLAVGLMNLPKEEAA